MKFLDEAGLAYLWSRLKERQSGGDVVRLHTADINTSGELTEAGTDSLWQLIVYGKSATNGSSMSDIVKPTVSVGTTAISIPYTLRSVGDVRDVIDFRQGVLIRRIEGTTFREAFAKKSRVGVALTDISRTT